MKKKDILLIISLIIFFTQAIPAFSDPPSAPILADPGTTDDDGYYRLNWSSWWDTIYEICYDTDVSFSSPTTYWSVLQQKDIINPNGTFYHRIRAWNGRPDEGGEAGDWSNVEDITVAVASTPSANSVLLLDDFNDGVSTNEFGGVSGAFGANGGICTNEFYNTDRSNVYGREGYSLKLHYDVTATTTAFSGYWSKLNSVDLSNYNYVSFRVKGVSSGEYFKIEMKNNLGDDDTNHAAVYVTDYLDGGVTNQWRKVVIPLDAFCNISDWTSMKEFNLVFERTTADVNGSPIDGDIYVDNIMFGSWFPGFVRIDHFGDKLGTNSLGGNMGTGEFLGYDPYYFLEDEYYSYSNGVMMDYEVPLYDSYAYTYSLFGGGADGWTKVAHDFSRYSYISFSVKAKSATENPYVVTLELHDNDEWPHPGYVIWDVDTSWQEVKIPLSLVKYGSELLDLTHIQEMVLVFKGSLIWYPTGAIHVDDVQFAAAGYEPDTSNPASPTALKDDAEDISSGHIFQSINVLSVTADTGLNDPTLESVWFEYRDETISDWCIIGSDYDTGDSTYSAVWDVSELDSSHTFSVRAVSQDATGNMTLMTAETGCIIVGEHSLSVDISGSVDFGIVSLGSVVASNSYFTVINSGSIPSTYVLALINPQNWTASTSQATDQYVLNAAFSEDAGNISFNETDHAMSEFPVTATSTRFAGDSTGVNVSPSDERKLWFEFKAPTQTSTEDPQQIIIVISAQSAQ